MNTKSTEAKLANDVSAKIIARAWSDPKFKAKLLADPVTTMREEGVVIPDGIEFKVVEQDDCNEKSSPSYVLILPPRPTAEEIGAEDLSVIAAAKCSGTWWNLCGT